LAAGAPRTSRIYSSSTYAGGFKADEVPLKWLKQLMVVRAEGLAGGSSGGGRKSKGKGKGKMQAAADDGVSSSDEDAAWELKDKEQLEASYLPRRAPAPALEAAQEVVAPQEVVAAAQPLPTPDAAAAPPPTTATTLAWLTIAAPGDRWGGCCCV
jgi:hypothetical protein